MGFNHKTAQNRQITGCIQQEKAVAQVTAIKKQIRELG